MQIKIKIGSCRTADSKPVKQEVNSTVILPPLVFPGSSFSQSVIMRDYYINNSINSLQFTGVSLSVCQCHSLPLKSHVTGYDKEYTPTSQLSFILVGFFLKLKSKITIV